MRARLWRPLAGAGLVAFALAPLVPLAIWSVAHGWRFPDLLPADWSLKAWRQALSPTSGVLESLGLTCLVAAVTTALALLIGLPAARALGMHRFRGRALVLLLVAAPAVVPGIAVALGLHGIFLRLGLTGSVPGVVLAHLIPVQPYVILILTAVFARLDPDLESQARSLGATPAQVLAHVALPAIRPGLLTAALFAFLVSWSQYLLTLAIGGGRVETLPLTLFAYVSAGRNDMAGAIAMLYILPGLLVLALTARSITGRSPALAPGLRP